MFDGIEWKQKFSFLMLAVVSTILVGSCSNNNTNNKNIDSTQSQTAKSSNDSRLKTIRDRESLICGINGQLPGFSFIDDNGKHMGMDVDLCRAVAAALFDDPTKVKYVVLSAQERFNAVRSGKVDLLSRNTTWTISRDTSEGMNFAPTTFYDAQGLLVTKKSGVEKLEDLDGKSVCVLSGTTNEQNLAERMRRLTLNYYPAVFENFDLLYDSYERGTCQAVTGDISQLTARRSILNQPEDHQVLDVVISKEPLGASVANNDPQWFDVVKWVIYAMIQAENLGINSENIDVFSQTKSPEIKRFLGIETVGNREKKTSLSSDFAKRVVKHVGNYGEIYERNVGQPFGLERGLNALWKDGGLMYAPPFR